MALGVLGEILLAYLPIMSARLSNISTRLHAAPPAAPVPARIEEEPPATL